MEELNAFIRLIEILRTQPVLTLFLLLGMGYLLANILNTYLCRLFLWQKSAENPPGVTVGWNYGIDDQWWFLQCGYPGCKQLSAVAGVYRLLCLCQCPVDHCGKYYPVFLNAGAQGLCL